MHLKYCFYLFEYSVNKCFITDDKAPSFKIINTLCTYIFFLLPPLSHPLHHHFTSLEGQGPEKEVPPEFRTLTQDATVIVGEPVTFDCQITATPKPDIHWTKVKFIKIYMEI